MSSNNCQMRLSIQYKVLVILCVSIATLFSSNAVAQFNYNVYEGSFDQLPDFSTLEEPVASGYSNIVHQYVADNIDKFGVTFTNQIVVPTSGNYFFRINSSGGSRLYIDDVLIVDNNGLHSPTVSINSTFLDQGAYNLRVEYFNNSGTRTIDVGYGIDNINFKPIPANGLLDRIGESNPYVIGEWGPVVQWPELAISGANLPDGRIITWSTTELSELFRSEREYTHSSIYDPATDTFEEVDSDFHDMFCAGISLLQDGTIVASGGSPTDKRTSGFDITSLTWMPLADMLDERWYGSNITLPENQIFSTFARGSGNRSEMYLPDSDKWLPRSKVTMQTLVDEQNQINAADNPANTSSQEWWAHLSVTPEGKVLQAGPTSTWHIMDPVSNNDNVSLGQPTGDSARMYGNSITYDAGKVLLIGGYDRRLAEPTSVNNVYKVDLNGAAPLITQGAPMIYSRAFSNSVTLPNSEILVVGGNTSARVFSDLGSIMPAEIYSPEENSWRVVDSIDVPRNYHSIALLLKDGRVFSSGGGGGRHMNGQFFSPPYLFNEDGSLATRPVITNSPVQAEAGEEIVVNASADTRSFSMIRLSGTTHHLNTDQRFLPLESVDNGDGTFSLSLEANPNILIAGYYWIFALNENGTPSVGQTLQIIHEQQPVTGPQEIYVSDLPWLSSVNGWNGDVKRDTNNDNGDIQLNGVVYNRGVGGHAFSQIEVELNGEYERFLSDIGLDDSRDGRCGVVAFEVDVDNNSVYISSDFRDSTPTESIDIDLIGAELLTLRMTFGSGGDCGNSGVWANARLKTYVASGPDADGDGVPDEFDAFPNDPSETTDSDGDGVGDNADAFPNDASETTDSDGDGVGDNADAFPNDPDRTTDAEITPLPVLPSHSSTLIVESLTGVERLWNVNPDNHSVSVSDSEGNLLTEIQVGDTPWSLALSPMTSQVYITNKQSATLSIINVDTLTVDQTLNLKSRSQPHGIVFNQSGSEYYVVLESTAELEKRETITNALINTLSLSGTPRHLSIAFDDSVILVSNFITPPIAGEATATVQLDNAAAQIFIIQPESFTLSSVAGLSHDNRVLSESQGPGMPNYLGAPVISFDNQYAYVPSKKDNIQSGILRESFPLTFDSAVRAQTSRLTLGNLNQDSSFKVDHDNASVATSAALSGDSRYLFVTLETSRELAVYDTEQGFPVMRLPTGRAPQSVVLSEDGSRAYVHNFMDRSISRFDLSQMLLNHTPTVTALSTVNVVTTETLNPEVLLGKQHFYDAADDRLARDNYMSCASCHKEGKHDGRVWDFSQFGEGLRSTVSLLGKGGMQQGLLHWTGNFDEVQDFEGQIRGFAGGTGLMSDADFNIGSRSQPLGDSKIGISVDLDALAAYLNSLTEPEISPFVLDNGLSVSAELGQQIFVEKDCQSCHTGTFYTDSSQGIRHDIGTLTTASGQRLSASLDGIDTPSLLGLWQNAPYLHDGSATTLMDAIQAHSDVNITESEADLLTTFLYELTGPQDTDGDGVIDHLDLYPNDPVRSTGIWREWWKSIEGNTIADLEGSANFPNNPEGSEQVSHFSGPINWSDKYGTRIRGIFYAPVSGDYTFWASGDDNVALYLSVDSNPNNKSLIASVPGWTAPQQWTKFVEQKSAPISLVAGQAYYVEALHKEGAGGDNLDIGWQLNGVGNVQLLTEEYFHGPITGPIDSDGDGVKDHLDTFPLDASETADSDGDGIGDNKDPYPNDATNTPGIAIDSDGDGVSDAVDLYPSNAGRSTGIWREWWTDIGGMHVADLTSLSSFPANPDGREQREEFAGPVNWSNNYGTRILGIFYPQVSGDYTFWVSGDKTAELYISTDGNPLNKSLIASVPNWTAPLQWDRYPQQQSMVITLEADQPYYMEVLHKARGGGNHVTVGWQLPGTDIQVLSADYFEGPTIDPTDIDGDGVKNDVDLYPEDPERGSGVWRDWWTNISGNTISTLTESSRFPSNPDGNEELLAVAGPSNWGGSYGTRIRGYFYAPVSGGYTFAASGDDSVELYLSSDINPLNKTLIASVPAWTDVQQWNKYPEQQSSTITLVEGQAYYMEVLHKEGGGGDHLSIAWRLNGIGDLQLLTSEFFHGPVEGPIDSDGDGIKDNVDAFPLDASETTDTDGDGIGDNKDPYPTDASNSPDSSVDSDGDGVSDIVDLYPSDASRSTGVWREWWSNIAGDRVEDLTNLSSFPANPDGRELLVDGFEGPENWGDNYGTRLHGIFYAPMSGEYTFWVSGDRSVELYLSSDGNPLNKIAIASVPDWTLNREWAKYPQQQSIVITLEAGQPYYIEALQKARGGGDHLSVGWTLPGSNIIEVMDSQFFNQE